MDSMSENTADALVSRDGCTCAGHVTTTSRLDHDDGPTHLEESLFNEQHKAAVVEPELSVPRGAIHHAS